MRLRLLPAFLIALSSLSAAHAQTTPAGKAEFEVASIRPSGPLDTAEIRARIAAGQMPRFGVHIDGLSAEYLRMPLRALISRAYDVQGFQITVPKDINTEPFDITARMPEGSTRDDERAMLLNLLEHRFHLQATRSNDETPVFDLTVGKGGPKLKESATRLQPIDPATELKPNQIKQESLLGTMIETRNPDHSVLIDMGEKGKLTEKADPQTRAVLISGTATIPALATLLTQLETGGPMADHGGRPIVDATGLKGAYDISLELSMNTMSEGQRSASGTEATDPAGSMGLDESLAKMGLKLEPGKAPIPHVTVTHIDKMPTEN